MTSVADHKMVTFNNTNTSGEYEEFENSITLEISKYNYSNEAVSQWGLHLKKQTRINSKKIYKMLEKLMRALDTTKKANKPFYIQRRTIELQNC